MCLQQEGASSKVSINIWLTLNRFWSFHIICWFQEEKKKPIKAVFPFKMQMFGFASKQKFKKKMHTRHIFLFPPSKLQHVFKKRFSVLDVKIMLFCVPFSTEMQNVNPNSQKKGLCQWKKMTLNTSFTVCTLMSRRKQNCPSEPVIIWASYCNARCTVSPEHGLHLPYTPLQNETSQALM